MTESSAHRIIQYGSDLVGASSGFAIEFLGKAPAGVGGPVAVVVASVLKEFGGRLLSRREQARIGGVTLYAIDRIGARLLSGHIPRADGFLEPRTYSDSPSEELFERVLARARDESQQRKLRHLGFFFANLVFSDQVSPETAHLLLKQLERVSYRQLAILSLVGEKGVFDVQPLRSQDHLDPELEALKREEMDLHSSDLGTMGLLRGESPWGDVLSTLGRAFYDLAALEEFPVEEKNKIAATVEALRKPSTKDPRATQ